MMLALLLSGCASIIPLYEEARTEALSDPGAPGARWVPDARVDLSNAALDDLLQQLVVGTAVAEAPVDLGLGSMTPHLVIRKFELLRDHQGEGLAADVRIEGPITVKTPLGKVEQKLAAEGRLGASLTVEPRGDGYALVVHPNKLDRLTFEADGLPVQALTTTVRDLVLAALPDFDVAEFPADELPIRAMEVDRTEQGIALRIRTAAQVGEPLPTLGTPPTEGFRIAIGASSLQQLARRQAFLSGPLTHDVVPEPTSLAISPGGDFVLGLRLWRPVGRGWWRTCEVKGSFKVRNGQLKLEADSVEELDQSKGAAWVDPLMALAEGVVFRSMEKAMDLSVPAMRTDKLGGGVKAATHVETVEVVGQALVANGDLDLTTKRKREP
jgi:hypothetical protein